ncbi:MAG: glutathione S-transferase family protein [Pseudomonadales bacterium]|nr:glutathione S-transferase family protein [Pseudomonadales bacterium]
MKLFNSMGPNPQVVRMFAAEKGLELKLEEVDLMAGENRQAAFIEKNPSGQLPCLELDNGDFLSEITVICEYLEELNPKNSLIGTTAEERAETRMWVRRVDLGICENLANGFRFSAGLQLFKDRMITLPDSAEGLMSIAQDRIKWLDGELGNKTFICGDRLTLADILLFCFINFGAGVGQPLNPDFKNVTAWFNRMSERPSAKA